MRSLFLIRHAKTSWKDPSQNDFYRILNDRGNRDAPIMAKRLLQKNIPIDAFISSPATRALATCQYFAKAFGRKNEDIIREPQLYHASSSTIFDVVKQVNDNYRSIAIFSHNPGITDFVNCLTEIKIDNMPTCAIFAVQVKTEKWEHLEDANKTFLFFDHP